MSVATLEVRRAAVDDRAGVLALVGRCLGWTADADDARLFAWKHEQSPFGASPSWVAVDADRIVGFRTFLRWEFERAGETVRAVRAVDTATDPDYRGRGIFRQLTLQALDELRAEGIAFVFNTPNDQSRPGYLKMGWQPVGRLPTMVRPRRLAALPRIAKARTAAQRWSEPIAAGLPADRALAEADLPALLASQPAQSGLRTRRSAEYLRWRYASSPLAYRAITEDGGMALFRVRRRGSAREATVGDVLVPGGDHRLERRLLRAVARSAGVDYALRLGRPGAGYVPLPRQGPLLTWCALAETTPPSLAEWRLTLGDIELF